MPGQATLASDALGPVRFMNPTARYVAVPRLSSAGEWTAAGEMAVAGKDAGKDAGSSKARHHVYHVWRSRDNRKGRHAVVVSRAFYLHSLQHHLREHEEKAAARRAAALRATNSLRETLRGIGKMATCWPVWDISFDVAVLFTLGSVIWVINSFFVWLPLQVPSATFTNESGTGGGVTALVGATVFEVGALLGLLEAVNENRGDCFGWALEEVVAAGAASSGLLLRPSPDGCRHHQAQRRRLLGAKGSSSGSDDSAGSADAITTATPDSEAADAPSHSDTDVSDENDANGADGTAGTAGTAGMTGTVWEQPSPGPSPLQRRHHRQRQWSWCPSWHELRTHYLHEIGFWACASQVVAATIFWISGFTGLPPVLDNLPLAAQNGIFWLPQVVGGVGFVISSLLFMLETQPCWYMPAPGLLGWHIGLWNLVGSIGFALCGAFGFAATQSHNMEYASCLSTFIGSWAFLIGSIIQWYESLDKYPVAVKSSIRGENMD